METEVLGSLNRIVDGGKTNRKRTTKRDKGQAIRTSFAYFSEGVFLEEKKVLCFSFEDSGVFRRRGLRGGGIKENFSFSKFKGILTISAVF